MNKKLSVLGGAIALFFNISAHAAPVDLFSVPISVGGGSIKDTTVGGPLVINTVTDAADPGSILGGVRDAIVTLYTDNAPINLNNGVSMDIVGDNTLAFNNDTNAGGEGIIQWNGQAGFQDLTTAGTFGLGGIDAFTLGNAFTYQTLTVDIGFWFSVAAYTNENSWTKFELLTTGTGTESIAFNSFENAICGTSTATLNILCGTNRADMSNLGALEARLNLLGGSLAVDLSISQLTTIPEPSVIGLMGAGLLSAGFAGTRRRTNTLQA